MKGQSNSRTKMNTLNLEHEILHSGLNYTEIAKLHGITPQAVGQMARRLRARMAKQPIQPINQPFQQFE